MDASSEISGAGRLDVAIAGLVRPPPTTVQVPSPRVPFREPETSLCSRLPQGAVCGQGRLACSAPCHSQHLTGSLAAFLPKNVPAGSGISF